MMDDGDDKRRRKKDGILTVATVLFAANGFEATSVRRIASESGLSVPGMFHYFASKEEILAQIIFGFIEEAYLRLNEIIQSDLDPESKLRTLCSFYVQRYASHQNELTILNSEGKSLSPKHQKDFVEKQRIYLEALENIFQEFTEQGILKPLNHVVLSFLFYGMVGWTSTWYNPKGLVSPKELGDIISEVFLHGIMKK
ncbi:MAG: TetR/AcrR family transcriptional regulator [Desulfatiglandales bacterium]